MPDFGTRRLEPPADLVHDLVCHRIAMSAVHSHGELVAELPERQQLGVSVRLHLFHAVYRVQPHVTAIARDRHHG